MKRSMALFAVLALVAGLCLLGWRAAASDAAVATPRGEWSAESNGLVARLVVEKPVIKASEHFEVNLELKNVGWKTLVIDTGEPADFDAAVFDGGGQPLSWHSERIELLVSPSWAVVPRDTYIGFRGSASEMNRAEDSKLDTVTQIWKLPPGRYKLGGKYSSGGFVGGSAALPHFPEQLWPNQPSAWAGEIQLVPVEIEVLAE